MTYNCLHSYLSISFEKLPHTLLLILISMIITLIKQKLHRLKRYFILRQNRSHIEIIVQSSMVTIMDEM